MTCPRAFECSYGYCRPRWLPTRRSRKFGVLWRYAGRSQERWPTHCAGLRIDGNPVGDVSHASDFRWAVRLSVPPPLSGHGDPYRLPNQAHILVVPKMDGSSPVNVNPALRPDIGSDVASSKAPADAAPQPLLRSGRGFGISVLFAVAGQCTITPFTSRATAFGLHSLFAVRSCPHSRDAQGSNKKQPQT